MPRSKRQASTTLSQLVIADVSCSDLVQVSRKRLVYPRSADQPCTSAQASTDDAVVVVEAENSDADGVVEAENSNEVRQVSANTAVSQSAFVSLSDDESENHQQVEQVEQLGILAANYSVRKMLDFGILHILSVLILFINTLKITYFSPSKQIPSKGIQVWFKHKNVHCRYTFF